MDFGSSFYSEPFDMKGAKSLLVEARLVPVAADPLARGILQVQGTDDSETEKRNWVSDGSSIDLAPRTESRVIFNNMRGTVRVKGDLLSLGGEGRIEFRLTRLP